MPTPSESKWLIKPIYLSLMLIGLLPLTLNADSLWDNSQVPLYGVPKKEIRVGDIIIVNISEQTSAVQEATTKTSKQSQLGSDFINNWDQVANIQGNETLRKRNEFELRGDDGYEGLGSTSRKSRIKTIISATVTEILDNGNIFIIGEHKIKVNDEVETIRIAGIVRPEDIRADNSINSFQIAKKEMSINGAGVVGSKQTPGIMTKMLNWFF